MGDLELFWHNENIQMPDLIRIAISHYQFETIHPFLDGNGRIGRLLITLYLVSKGLLRKPSLYLSAFFERNRASYYDALMSVRMSNDITHWVKFFLSAVIDIGSKGKRAFEDILSLKQAVDKVILGYGKRAENADILVRRLYKKPTISPNQAAAVLNVTPTAAGNLLAKMTKDGILTEITGFKRNRVFTYDRYLRLFSDN